MSKPSTRTKSARPKGLTMPDAGFHIAVMGALLDADLLSEETVEKHARGVAKAVAKLDEDDMEGRLALVLARLHEFPLPASKVAKIESLDFDGGNTIYMTLEEVAETNSGGETSVYSSRSLDGIAALTALTRLDNDSHGCPDDGEALDLAPLAGCQQLEEIWLPDCKSADVLLGLPKLKRVRLLGPVEVAPADALDRLRAKGVAIES